MFYGNEINLWRWKFIPVLPLVYDDALSYYECLCKLIDYINEAIEIENDNYKNLNDKIVGFDNHFNSLDDKLKRLEDKHDKDVKNLRDCCKQNYDKLENEIKRIERDFNGKIIHLYDIIINNNEYILHSLDKKFEDFLRQVDYMLKDYTLLMVNPLTGKEDKISNVIIDIYETMRYHAIACFEFDGSEITCEEFDNYKWNNIYDLTCLRFDLYGRDYFYKNYHHYLFDPVSGNYELIQYVLYRWFTMYRNNLLDVTGFDESEKDISILDSLEKSAYEYDTETKNFMIN